MLKQEKPALPFFKNERFRAPTVSLAQNSAVSYFKPTIKFRENPEIFLNGLIKDLKKETPQAIIKKEMETSTQDLSTVQQFRKKLSIASQSQSEYDGSASIDTLSTQKSVMSVDPIVKEWVESLQFPTIEKKQRFSKSAEIKLMEQRTKQRKAEEKILQAEQAEKQLMEKLSKEEQRNLISNIYQNVKQSTGLQKISNEIKKEVEGMVQAGYTLAQATSAILEKKNLQKRIKQQAEQATTAKAEISDITGEGQAILTGSKKAQKKQTKKEEGLKTVEQGIEAIRRQKNKEVFISERLPEILTLEPKEEGMTAQSSELKKKIEKLLKRVLNIDELTKNDRETVKILLQSGMNYKEIKDFITSGLM